MPRIRDGLFQTRGSPGQARSCPVHGQPGAQVPSARWGEGQGEGDTTEVFAGRSCPLTQSSPKARTDPGSGPGQALSPPGRGGDRFSARVSFCASGEILDIAQKVLPSSILPWPVDGHSARLRPTPAGAGTTSAATFENLRQSPAPAPTARPVAELRPRVGRAVWLKQIRRGARPATLR